MEYVTAVWDLYQKALFNSLRKVQKWAAMCIMLDLSLTRASELVLRNRAYEPHSACIKSLMALSNSNPAIQTNTIKMKTRKTAGPQWHTQKDTCWILNIFKCENQKNCQTANAQTHFVPHQGTQARSNLLLGNDLKQKATAASSLEQKELPHY